MKEKKHGFNLSFDNLAIPEIHPAGVQTETASKGEADTVTFEDVAIPEVHIKRSKEMEQLIVQLRQQLHEIPEPSMKETKTKQTIMHFLKKHTSFVVVDMGEWFYAVKKAKVKNAQKPIAFRADMDAVCGADGQARHLCGHDGHCSILCGIALYFSKQEKPLNRDIYLIFQPGEEIGQGAILCKNLLQEKEIEEIYGLHNIPGYEKNRILVREKTFACASTGLSIRLKGVESHAAYPEAGRNPAVVFAKLILDIKELEQNFLQKQEYVQMTVVGMKLGEKNFGVSAGEGELYLTLRGEQEQVFEHFISQILEKTETYAKENGLKADICEVDRFPATENEKESVDKICVCAEKLQFLVEHLPSPMRWSEDFGYYLQTTKGAFFGIGDGVSHAQLHTLEYEFPDDIIKTGILMFVTLAE